jgi:hypothetical protein
VYSAGRLELRPESSIKELEHSFYEGERNNFIPCNN